MYFLCIYLKNPRYSLFYSSSPTYDQQIDTEVLCGRMLEINPASVCSFVFISKVLAQVTVVLALLAGEVVLEAVMEAQTKAAVSIAQSVEILHHMIL